MSKHNQCRTSVDCKPGSVCRDGKCVSPSTTPIERTRTQEQYSSTMVESTLTPEQNGDNSRIQFGTEVNPPGKYSFTIVLLRPTVSKLQPPL